MGHMHHYWGELFRLFYNPLIFEFIANNFESKKLRPQHMNIVLLILVSSTTYHKFIKIGDAQLAKKQANLRFSSVAFLRQVNLSITRTASQGWNIIITTTFYKRGFWILCNVFQKIFDTNIGRADLTQWLNARPIKLTENSKEMQCNNLAFARLSLLIF